MILCSGRSQIRQSVCHFEKPPFPRPEPSYLGGQGDDDMTAARFIIALVLTIAATPAFAARL